MREIQEVRPVFVTVAAAARRVGVSSNTIARWAAAGTFPALCRVGGVRMVPREAFEQWLASKMAA